MNKSQKLGILSICVGVVLFLPLMLLASGTAVFMGGENVTWLMQVGMAEMGMGVPLGTTFLGGIEYMGAWGTTFWCWMASFGTILIIISSVTLIGFGVLLVCKKMEEFVKFVKTGLIVAGSVAIFTSLMAIISVFTADALSLGGLIGMTMDMGAEFDIEMVAMVGLGSIFLLLVGIATVLVGAFSDKIFNDKVVTVKPVKVK